MKTNKKLISKNKNITERKCERKTLFRQTSLNLTSTCMLPHVKAKMLKNGLTKEKNMETKECKIKKLIQLTK
jgi:hypothetical protein